MWIHVIPHFSRFLQELELKPWERSDAESKAERVAHCLHAKYYGGDFNPHCYLKVGSYGKGTATRPPSDLDMLFLIPSTEFARVNQTVGNKQSQLLQEVKRALEWTFPRTDLRADGQVVVAPFQTYNVDVTPAFLCKDGTYLTANTASGGSWRVSNPVAEYQLLTTVNSACAGKATDLSKMLKAWKRECSVDIKSISLEVLACGFVEQWPHRMRDLYWYDWMIRDFFEFMLRYKNGWTLVAGTSDKIQLGDSWFSKCESAYNRSLKACDYERSDYAYLAADEWQKIFGQQFTALTAFARVMAASR
jgi:Second Messenger Oligonucleotide or Dinucleotide Synthetase domain